MPEFQVGDIVRVEMPRGYNTRGVLGISLLFSTSPEAKFEGAIGTITQINPVGTHTVHQYLVDFRTHDNSRAGIPWQAQWFREEWLALKERPESVAAEAVKTGPEATWPTKPEEESAAGGIAHPGAKIYTEGRTDFAPPGLDPTTATGTVPASAYGVASPAATGEVASSESSTDVEQLRSDPRAEMPWPDVSGSTEAGQQHMVGAETNTAFSGPDPAYDRSAADTPTYEPTLGTATGTVDSTTPTSAASTFNDSATVPGELIVEQGDGFVRVQGMSTCPDGFPIKGNASSGIYHRPTDSSYQRTIPEVCFTTEESAIANGYRAPGQRKS